MTVVDVKAKSEELRSRAAKLLADARKIKDKADAEERSLSAEERQQIDRMMADMDSALDEAKLEERMAGIETRIAPEERGRRLPEVVDDPEATPEEREAATIAERPEYREAFYRYARFGLESLTSDDRDVLNQVRALSEGTDADGGYLVPPTLLAGVEREMLAQEQLAPRMNTINTTVRSVQQVQGVDVVQAQWVNELAPKPEDQPSFKRVQITARTGAVIVRVSEELLEDSTFNLESYLSTLAAEAKVELEEASFVSGTGTGQPFGILTRLNAETGTPNRYTTAAAGTLAADDFVRALYGLAPRYRRRAAWVLGTQAIIVARLLKEGGAATNQYLWQPGLQAGDPATLLGKPVYEAADREASSGSHPLDNPVATGNDIGIVGDLRRYTVLRRLNLQVKRLEELYAATDEVGFRFRFRTGGDVQNTKAFRSIRVL